MRRDKKSKEPQELTFYKVQDNLVSAIKQHIADTQENNLVKQNRIPQTIGIEGTWGSGKSNVILKLTKQKTIQNKYENYKTHFFTFNIWEHQVEPIKHIFLKDLINDLIKNQILRDSTTIKIKDKEITEKWANIFDTITATRTYQKQFIFYPIAFCAFIFPILLGLDWVKQIITENILEFVTVFILIFLMFICIWLSDKTYKLFYKSLYSESLIIELNNNVIKQLIKNISEELKKQKKLLIITFDNSDRCNLEKIEETLTFIYSIFSEDTFDNIWVILTYDYQRLSEIIRTKNFPENLNKGAPIIDNQINDKKEDTYNLTIEKNDNYIIDSYLTKVLYSIFRIPDPANIDYESTFNNFYHTIFNIEKQQKEIQGKLTELAPPLYKIYRIEHNKLIFRELISFINDLKTINNCLTDKSISLLSIAIFILNKRSLIYQDINYILNFQLNTSYIEILNSENLNINQVRIQLIAIVYNIDCKRALFNIIESVIESNIKKDQHYKELKTSYGAIDTVIMDSLSSNVQFYEIIPRNNKTLILKTEKFNDLLFNINLLNLDKNEYIHSWRYYCRLYGIDFSIRKLINNLDIFWKINNKTSENINAIKEIDNQRYTTIEILSNLSEEKQQQLHNPNYVRFFSYEIFALYRVLSLDDKNFINLLQQIEEIYFVNHQQVFDTIVNSGGNKAAILADYFLATYIYANNIPAFKNDVVKYVKEWDINKIQEYFWEALCLISKYSIKDIDNIESDNNSYTTDYKSKLKDILDNNNCVKFILNNINKTNIDETFKKKLSESWSKKLQKVNWTNIDNNFQVPLNHIIDELLQSKLFSFKTIHNKIWEIIDSLSKINDGTPLINDGTPLIPDFLRKPTSSDISYIANLFYLYRKTDTEHFAKKEDLIYLLNYLKNKNVLSEMSLYSNNIFFHSDIFFILALFTDLSLCNIKLNNEEDNNKNTKKLKDYYEYIQETDNTTYHLILKEYDDIVRYYSTKEETLEILKNKNEDGWFYNCIKEALESASS